MNVRWKHAGSVRTLCIAGLVVSIAILADGCNSNTTATGQSNLVPPATQNAGNRVRYSTAGTINVDLRPYMAAVIAQNNGGNLSGDMLCDINPSKADHCLTSMSDTAGEARIVGSKGSGVDYIAIGSHDFESINGSSTKRIGVIRDFTGPVSGNVLRCFELPNTTPCAKFPPEKSLGPPYLIPQLPVVDYEALKDASDPSYGDPPGSPLQPIAGSMLFTNTGGNGYLQFGLNSFNTPSGNCQNQTYTETGSTKGLVVYVKSVPFGGTIGTQDAIVVDGYSGQSSINDHVERHLYVLGYGRVGFGVGWYNPNDGKYDQYNEKLGHTDYYADHGNYEAINTNYFDLDGNQCTQGSAVPLWPSAIHRR